MPKKRNKTSDKAWLWRSPCLVTLTLLLIVAIAAAIVQRGIMEPGSVRAALLGGALMAGLIGTVSAGKKEHRPIRLLLGPGIPALILLAAILLGRGEGDKKWSLVIVLLLLLPGLCRMILGEEKGRKRRPPVKRASER